MIKQALPLLLTLALAQASPVRAASIASMPWNTSNASALRAAGRAGVAVLLTQSGRILHAKCACVKASDIGEFRWADLEGNGKLELVATMDVNGRHFFNALYVLWRSPTGKVTVQGIDGWMIRDLGKVIRDLNGDGQDELVVPTVLFQYSTAGTYTWPVVYRLQKGKYVEASPDFPSFYEYEVLPKVEKQIANSGRGNAAMLTLEKDQILRMLGRDPAAGLQHAEQWMNSDDPLLLLAATWTFGHIPGHQSDVKAARAAYVRALCRQHPRMVMCKKLPPRWRSEPAPTSESVGSSGGGSPSRTAVHHEAPTDRNGIAMHPRIPQ